MVVDNIKEFGSSRSAVLGDLRGLAVKKHPDLKEGDQLAHNHDPAFCSKSTSDDHLWSRKNFLRRGLVTRKHGKSMDIPLSGLRRT